MKNNSTSLFFIKEYYQSDRPTPAHYRHSQSDLTEWEESNQNRDQHHQRRSGPSEREVPSNYPLRNGSRDKEEWDDGDRVRRDGR